MYCRKCGSEIPEGGIVCPQCGTPVEKRPPAQTETPPKVEKPPKPEKPPKGEKPPKAVKPPKPPKAPGRPGGPVFARRDTGDTIDLYIKKKFVGALVVVLVIAVVALTLLNALMSVLRRVDVTDYLKIETEGYNGHGRMIYSLDEEELRDALAGKKDFEDLDEETRSNIREAISMFYESIRVKGGDGELSNGDQITFTFRNLEKIQKDTELRFKDHDELVYEVKELEETEDVDVGGLFEASFRGYDGAGCVLLHATEAAGDQPFDVFVNEGGVEVGGWYLPYTTSGNEGRLTNGDTFSIGLEIDEEMNSHFVEEYGVTLSGGEPKEYTVEGLSAPQTLDVFPHFDVTVEGIEGEAEARIVWHEQQIADGVFVIGTNESDSRYFEIYTTNPQDYRPLAAEGSDEGASPDMMSIGTFRLDLSKSEGLTGNESITVSIIGEADDMQTDFYKGRGLLFASLEKEISVDGAALSRYVTSGDQLNNEMAQKLAAEYSASAEEYLRENWGRIVHDSSSFVCYDQAVQNGPNLNAASLYCSDQRSNIYELWALYHCFVTDSELEEPASVYLYVRLPRPRIGAEDGALHTDGTPEYGYARSIEEIQGYRWFSESEALYTFG